MTKKKALLPSIKSPDDIKKLDKNELDDLADELREFIIRTVADNGGHLSSNLGTAELSIALHRVFNSPEDKIVWDVGHQCYAHKILTGRYNGFSALRKRGGIAGFPKQSESPHDAFNTGHASTSISAALGLLAAERAMGGKGHAIAVIGDGALTGGLAYEALSHAGHLGLPLIVILNDNKMSISANVGGLSKYLSRLSLKSKYQVFRRHFDAMVKKIPFAGNMFFAVIQRLKRAVKAVFYTDNFFVDLGFEYAGPIPGHNIQVLISILEDVKNLNRPVVVHVVTRKGKGYGYAEDEPDSYHGVSSFSVDNGLVLPSGSKNIAKGNITFSKAFSQAIVKAAQKEKKVIAITAAMKTGTGLSSFANLFKERFFDVGIAEEHAVTFAAGAAARGLKPVVAIYSTFIQRAFDQVTHDAALQKLPVILALDRAGLVADDGETHQGLFDIALFRSVPALTIFTPASANELSLMLDWAIYREQGAGGSVQGIGPVIIRYPKAQCPDEIPAFSQPLETGRGVFIAKNDADICLFFTGSLYREVIGASEILKERGINTDIYNLRFIKPIDENYFTSLIKNYKISIFIEEGISEGGFGEYAVTLASRNKCETTALVLAVDSSFLTGDNALGTREELLAFTGLDAEGIAKQVKELYHEPHKPHERRRNTTEVTEKHGVLE